MANIPNPNPKPPDYAEYGRSGGLKGGLSTSESKVQTARENGKLGGRPKSAPVSAPGKPTEVVRDRVRRYDPIEV